MRKIILILSLLLINSVIAHVPLGGASGKSLTDALLINNPLKSWVVYAELIGSETDYYKVIMNEGEKLRVGIITPNQGLNINLTIMHDDGHEIIVYKGELSDLKEYEPFTPSSYYNLFTEDLMITETGTYYIEVNGDGYGKYGLVVGYIESFDLIEWVKIPIDVINVHLWEGQNLLLLLLPFALVLLGGVFINCYHFKLKIDNWLKAFAFIGLLTYLGSSAMTITQMIISLIGASLNYSVILTIVFASLPIITAYATLRIILRERIVNNDRIKLFIYGVMGLVIWAGILIGPIMMMAGALMPIKSKRRVIKKKK